MYRRRELHRAAGLSAAGLQYGRAWLGLAPGPLPAAAAAAGMALSSVEHLAATCTVMFLAALGAGFLPMLVQVGPAVYTCALGRDGTPPTMLGALGSCIKLAMPAAQAHGCSDLLRVQ